jgi:threonine synthase
MDETGKIVKEPDSKRMRRDLFGASIPEDDTRATIAEIFRKYNILLEPHGAIAWKAIKEYSKSVKQNRSGKQLFISLETAHPAKFPDELQRIININPLSPESLSNLIDKKENYLTAGNDYIKIKELIQNICNRV